MRIIEQVTDIGALTSPSGMPLKKGDLILVYQTQGATMDNSNDAKKYGVVQSLNGAGRFEFINVVAVTGSKITISDACKGKASNKGPDPVKDPVVIINLPPGAEVVEEPHGEGWSCTRAQSTVLCTRESVPLGEAPPIIVKIRLPKDGSIDPVAVAVVSAPNNNDPVLSNNVARSELFRLVGGGYGCSVGPCHAPHASGLMLVGVGLALALALRRRRSFRAA